MSAPLIEAEAGTVWPLPQYLDLLAGQRLVYTFRHDRKAGIVVQLLAATAGEGTSSVARDLAIIAARMGGMRVLLLDLAPPGNTQLSALRNQCGVHSLHAESLTGAPDGITVHRTTMGALHVTERRINPNLPHPPWGAIFNTLRNTFDLVLADSPALDRSYDGIMLAPEADTNLLVVEAERTRSAVAQNLRDRVLDVGGAIAGVLLNKQRFYIPGFIYRHI